MLIITHLIQVPYHCRHTNWTISEGLASVGLCTLFFPIQLLIQFLGTLVMIPLIASETVLTMDFRCWLGSMRIRVDLFNW